MYSVIFSDGKEFKFTKNQITLIPYFNTLINSSLFIEKDIISISSSSIGFEYLHIYSTMDEIDIIDPLVKYLFAIKQCDYFGYDKLKTLLENKYGYKIDIKDVKENIGKEITIKIKYLMRIKITKRNVPIYIINGRNYVTDKYHWINNEHITEDGLLAENNIASSSEMHPEFILHKYFGEYIMLSHEHTGNNLGPIHKNEYFNLSHSNSKTRSTASWTDILLNYDNNLYVIEPIYEYPDYSSDNEINDIFKKRYKKKHNTYFTQIIKTILLLNKDDLICAYIKNSYKLLPEINEDDYNDIEHIVIKNEPKFNNKYFIKYLDDEIEVYENV